MSITISQTLEQNGTTYYQIDVKIPLRTISLKRRFQEFERLHSDLCSDLGINSGDFPYTLPKKRFNWLHSDVASERKPELEKWLNSVIKDQSIQKLPSLERFLGLPNNFHFEPSHFKKTGSLEVGHLDENTWLDQYHILNQAVSSSRVNDGGDRVAMRQTIARTYNPMVAKLEEALGQSGLSVTERKRRSSLLNRSKQKIDDLNQNLTKAPISTVPGSFPKESGKRIFGGETKDTINLSNTELIQQQVEIHENQDHQLEELRKIVARQRKMGVAINEEVEIQNQMLDGLSEDLDNTNAKMADARMRAKKIL